MPKHESAISSKASANPQQDRFARGETQKYRKNVEVRCDEKVGLRRDAVGSQVIDALEAQEIKGDRKEKGYQSARNVDV
jgi:hypothetical protein